MVIKRMLSAAFVILLFCTVLTGCSNSSSSSQDQLGLHLSSDPSDKTVISTVTRRMNWVVDYSDMEVLVRDSDLIVIASVQSIDSVVAENGFYNTHATIRISDTLKGQSSDSEISIAATGGYVSYEEYVKNLQPEEMEKQGLDWTEEEKQNGVIKAQTDQQNLLQEGEQYILCLRESEELGYVTVGSYHGIMRMDGDKVWRKENAGIFDKEAIIQSIRAAQES